jgi:flagellar protein FlaG
MAGSSISEMIFFIAAILVSSAVAITLIGVIDQYADEISDEASLMEGEMRSRMNIINDPLYVVYDTSSSNLTYYLKNTGTSELSMDNIVVSANGTAKAGDDISVGLMGNISTWRPGDTVEVTFTVPNLREGVDYNGWASTSGLSDKGQVRGSAQDTFVFRITGV